MILKHVLCLLDEHLSLSRAQKCSTNGHSNCLKILLLNFFLLFWWQLKRKIQNQITNLRETPVCSMEDVTTMFYQVEEIHVQHSNFVGKLQAKVDAWSDTQKVGDTFKELVSSRSSFGNHTQAQKDFRIIFFVRKGSHISKSWWLIYTILILTYKIKRDKKCLIFILDCVFPHVHEICQSYAWSSRVYTKV